MSQEKLIQKQKETGGKPTAKPTATTVAKPKVASGVSVIHGPVMDTFDLAGSTVREAVDMLKGPLGFDPDVNPLVNGEEVPHDFKLSDGDTLEFVRGAGEKGAKEPELPDGLHMTRQATTHLRQGKKVFEVPTQGLSEIMTTGMRLESGLLHPYTRVHEHWGSRQLTVLEIPPHARTVTWVSGDQDTEDKIHNAEVIPPGEQYENRFLAFPWIVLLYVTEENCFQVAEAFYRPRPLAPKDTELFYCNMCNVAQAVHCYGYEAWLCFAYLRAKGSNQYTLALDAIDHTLNAAFNRSSELNEGNSGWNTKMRSLDPRVSSLAAWEKASKRDPNFILEIPWPKFPRKLAGEIKYVKDRMAPKFDLYGNILTHGSYISRRR